MFRRISSEKKILKKILKMISASLLKSCGNDFRDMLRAFKANLRKNAIGGQSMVPWVFCFCSFVSYVNAILMIFARKLKVYVCKNSEILLSNS